MRTPVFELFFAACTALLLMGCAQAEEQDVPTPSPALELTGRVVDAADIFSPQYENDLTATLGQLESNTGVQLVVASTPDLEGRHIEAYALDLANAWGLGSAERDNGLLMLVAPQERQVRIEVGLGLEASIKDEEAAEILRRDVLPHFRNGDFQLGVSNGANSLIREVTPVELKEAA